MQNISTNKHTVIKDDGGRIVIVIADDLSSVDIGESIPEGTLGWDKDDGTINQYTAGAWTPTLGDTIIDGTLTVSGLSSSGPATFDGSIEVYGAGDSGGVKTYATSGGDAVAAHAHEGVITVDLDLAGVATKSSAVDFIPPRTLVWRSSVEVLVGFTGGSVTKFDVGIVGGTGTEFFSDVALIDALDFSASVSGSVATANNAGAQVIVNAKQAGGGAATVTTGKVRVTLWLSSIDGPDGSVYA